MRNSTIYKSTPGQIPSEGLSAVGGKIPSSPANSSVVEVMEEGCDCNPHCAPSCSFNLARSNVSMDEVVSSCPAS